ncbi:DUF2528 family protein [Caballeronia sp. INDeC2]|uniref:DUF2528 family protein n=1 Tax=Caballeronia sp. INDeC2 TaxID=2921747 RepID=UPI0020291AFA|nr:DUF2528 family protein [Caballeronia sp. INDeC2]
MKKRYHLTYASAAEMVLEIDHAVFTDAQFKECSDFWADKPNFDEWLKMVYLIALRESIASWSGTRSLREGREEGFPKMDGSAGIAIISFDDFEFDDFEIDLREATGEKA